MTMLQFRRASLDSQSAMLLVVCSLLAGPACGDDTAGEADAGAGRGGASDGGRGGQSGSGKGGTGGRGGTGGSSGAAGEGGGGGTPDAGDTPDLDDVDLTLDGLNQDLPAPSTDCLMASKPPLVGCIAVSGEFNGEAFDFSCLDGNGPANASVGPKTRVGACPGDLASGERLSVAFRLDNAQFESLPATFGYHSPPDEDIPTNIVEVESDDRALLSHGLMMGEFGFLLSETHDIEHAVAGVATYGPGWTEDKTSEFNRGSFALTLEAKSDCAPDADAHGCDTVRLRGNFYTRPDVEVRNR